jgi:hypothetical protein
MFGERNDTNSAMQVLHLIVKILFENKRGILFETLTSNMLFFWVIFLKKLSRSISFLNIESSCGSGETRRYNLFNQLDKWIMSLELILNVQSMQF